MVMKHGDYIESDLVNLEIDYIGEIEYCEELEEALGDPAKLADTGFYKKVGELSPRVL
jgi:hypothetical protein